MDKLTPAIQITAEFTLRNRASEKILWGPEKQVYKVLPKQPMSDNPTEELRFLASQVFADVLVDRMRCSPDMRDEISGRPWYLDTKIIDFQYVAL